MRPFRSGPFLGGEGEPAPALPVGNVELHFERAFTLAEVADKLGISLRQVQAHIDDRNLIAVNVGRGAERRDLRVLDEDLEGFIRRRKTGVVPPEKRTVTTKRHQSEAVAFSGQTFAERRAARLAARR